MWDAFGKGGIHYLMFHLFFFKDSLFAFVECVATILSSTLQLLWPMHKDVSVICHFSDISRAASSQIYAISSFSRFLLKVESCFTSYFWNKQDRIWLTDSWTTAELTTRAIRVQASTVSFPCSGNLTYNSILERLARIWTLDHTSKNLA